MLKSRSGSAGAAVAGVCMFTTRAYDRDCRFTGTLVYGCDMQGSLPPKETAAVEAEVLDRPWHRLPDEVGSIGYAGGIGGHAHSRRVLRGGGRGARLAMAQAARQGRRAMLCS